MVDKFWEQWDFWIFLFLSISSLAASIWASIEARKAKKAAREAGKTVRIQTITIELSEVISKLERLDMKIDFATARDLLSETNRRIRRFLGPFESEKEYSESISLIFNNLSEAKSSLLQVKPNDQESDVVKNSVYYSIENFISGLLGQLAGLQGKFEQRTINKEY